MLKINIKGKFLPKFQIYKKKYKNKTFYILIRNYPEPYSLAVDIYKNKKQAENIAWFLNEPKEINCFLFKGDCRKKLIEHFKNCQKVEDKEKKLNKQLCVYQAKKSTTKLKNTHNINKKEFKYLGNNFNFAFVNNLLMIKNHFFCHETNKKIFIYFRKKESIQTFGEREPIVLPVENRISICQTAKNIHGFDDKRTLPHPFAGFCLEEDFNTNRILHESQQLL